MKESGHLNKKPIKPPQKKEEEPDDETNKDSPSILAFSDPIQEDDKDQATAKEDLTEKLLQREHEHKCEQTHLSNILLGVTFIVILLLCLCFNQSLSIKQE